MSEIQELRLALTKLIQEQIIPMRDRLDELLNKEAEIICPFKKGEIIILDNGKKGKITDINYLSLNYDFATDENEVDFFNYLPKLDEIEYKWAYLVDNKKFSITWKISGFRLNKEDKVGKLRFVNINPISFLIDKDEKKVTTKSLSEYMGQDNITLFEEI